MERTTKIFLLDDTSKALKNQGFLERQLQSGHSFSSQPRYDRFDTAAYLVLTHRLSLFRIPDIREKIKTFLNLFLKVPAREHL